MKRNPITVGHRLALLRRINEALAIGQGEAVEMLREQLADEDAVVGLASRPVVDQALKHGEYRYSNGWGRDWNRGSR